MFWKRQVPIAIVFVVGLLTLFGWFIEQETIRSFVEDDATQWYDVIASFAVILGALNLLKLQGKKVLNRKKDWQYSILAILGFCFAFFAGFMFRGGNEIVITDPGSNLPSVAQVIADVQDSQADNVLSGLSVLPEGEELKLDKSYMLMSDAESVRDKLSEAGAVSQIETQRWGGHLLSEGSLFRWMFDNIFTPLAATMFALLAFFVASASYRAFRIRNFEATLLLSAGIILMLGRVPIGNTISAWFVAYVVVLIAAIVMNTLVDNRLATLATVVGGFILVTAAGSVMGWPIDRPAFLYLPKLQEWIYLYPNIAGMRAVMIGIALGMVGTSLRIILGIEKSFMGEK
ncbi:MAG: hypothetical protein QF551_03660 [Candidatus Marinimicrobia bacterium]|jgi:hypothetical protein|nr:hypothetical protein [Candidatus Neomarinimicrobiota bacterium]|tara:strand:- start:3656 stop:4690 length:1035 start_codon:yes stop_codon:yes gene_type:complete